MIRRTNYYSALMSRDYGKLRDLLDRGIVAVCFVDYVYDTGARKTVFRDVAKAKSNDQNPNGRSYGYVVEARGIVYISWDRRMQELRGVRFEELCEELNLEFIDHALY